MSENNYTPDAPFLNGSNGKYKLLIESVTPRFGNYEYELIDSEGRKYTAVSGVHYSENQLLRCMVSFDTINARFSVSSVEICKKQDLATPAPEEKKPKFVRKPDLTMDSREWIPFRELGNPISRRKSGVYKLCIVDLVKREKNNLYLLVDSANNDYRAISRKSLSVGNIVPCYMTVERTEQGIKAYVKSFDFVKTPHPRKRKSSAYKSGYGNNDLPAPAAGDHFHLIYTPMGNKR